MTKEKLLNQGVFLTNDPMPKALHISVNLVYRGNFNDERLIASRSIEVEELVGKPFVWFDPYLDMLNGSRLKIAFAYLDEATLYILVDDGNDIKAVEKECYLHSFSADYDSSYIIASSIW